VVQLFFPLRGLRDAVAKGNFLPLISVNSFFDAQLLENPFSQNLPSNFPPNSRRKIKGFNFNLKGGGWGLFYRSKRRKERAGPHPGPLPMDEGDRTRSRIMGGDAAPPYPGRGSVFSRFSSCSTARSRENK
jgi:hypothetical protein